MISNSNLPHVTTADWRMSRLALVMALIAPFASASLAQAQPFAYVVGQPNFSGGLSFVSVIDTSTNVRVASIQAGPNCSLCFNPDGIAIAANVGRVYVTNNFGQSVSVIDILSNTVVATLPIPGGPTSIVANPNGTRVYVLNGSGATSVSEIDTATNAVVKSTPLAVLQAQGMAITPDGTRLYVSTSGSNIVKVLATATMTVTATIPVGSQPFGVDVSPDGSHVYVASYLSNAVSVIDTATSAVGTIPVGLRPISARATPDGSRVYVANHESNNVSVIDRQTHTVVNTVELPPGSSPRTLDFTPDGTRAYVATSWGVQVIDLATNTLSAPIPFVQATDGYPASIVIGRALNGNPPTAVSESYLTNPNAPLNVAAPGVLANDNTDGAGPMTAELVSNVAHGSLTFNADGSFAYAPTAGLSATDSFTYRAVNAAGKSNIATVTLRLLTGPQPPTGFYVSSVVGNMVTLRWTPPLVGDAPTGYRLEGGVSPGHVAEGISIDSTAPIFTFLAPTGSFYIRMHTLSGGTRSAASEEIRLVVGVPAIPSAPTNLLGVVDGSTVSLAWRNTFEGGTPAELRLQVTGSLNENLPWPVADSLTVINVPPGTYTISMAARNATGPSGVSNAITLTVPAACSGVPAPPTNFVASRTGNLITVLWERATSGPAATGFVVNVSGSYVGSFPTPERTLSGRVGSGAYTITVQARNLCGDSAPTAPQTVVIP